jgi:hypothetical protein
MKGDIIMSSNGKSPKLSSEKVTPWMAKKRRFSTADVMSHFKVPVTKAAAALAIQRLKGKLESAGKDSNGTSLWVYTG